MIHMGWHNGHVTALLKGCLVAVMSKLIDNAMFTQHYPQNKQTNNRDWIASNTFLHYTPNHTTLLRIGEKLHQSTASSRIQLGRNSYPDAAMRPHFEVHTSCVCPHPLDQLQPAVISNFESADTTRGFSASRLLTFCSKPKMISFDRDFIAGSYQPK